MNRIPFEELRTKLTEVLLKFDFTADRAKLCARLFAETTRDGVYTHGVSRFLRFVAMIRNGCIDVAAEPELKAHFGAIERWDGNRGPGNLNAYECMVRAMALSRQHGIGCVSLGNTNHWMRGGTYGWQAVEAGLIAICWTNTLPNLPPWGGKGPCIGNNPLVMAVPRLGGPVVLDIAMSQFSYGALESYRRRGELLPVAGGFDQQGELTRDPAAIEKSLRPLPIGYWKGSGLSVVLDMMAAMMSLGRAAHDLGPDPLHESGQSQVFIAINPEAVGPPEAQVQIADRIVESIQTCIPAEKERPVRYPGKKTLCTREENQRLGVPVDPTVWAEILAM